MKNRLLPFVCLLAVLPVAAQNPKCTPIGIHSTTNDQVGKTFVYALQEQIRKSSTFCYDTASEVRWTLDVVSTPVNFVSVPVNFPQTTAAVSIVLVLNAKGYETYFTHYVVVVNDINPSQQADNFLANVNDSLTRIILEFEDKRSLLCYKHVD